MASEYLSTRRKYIASVAGGIAALSGCSNQSQQDGGDQPSTTPSTSSGSDGGSNDQLHIGISDLVSNSGPMTAVDMGGKWMGEDLGVKVSLREADGTKKQQLDQANNLINQGVDALIFTWGASVGKQIAEQADIPVFGASIPTNSEQLKLYTGIKQKEYATTATNKLMERVKQSGGSPPYRLLEMGFDQTNGNALLRHKFFKQTIEQSSDFEIAKSILINGIDQSTAQNKATSYLQSDQDIDGVISSWNLGAFGALSALDKFGMKKKKGESGHIPLVTMDGGPHVYELIKQQYIDLAVDQPFMSYAALAMIYTVDYLKADSGSDALPSTGDKIDEESMSLADHGGKHAGVNPWNGEVWSPAEVTTYTDSEGTEYPFPYVSLSFPLVDESNADEPYLWGNVLPKIQ